MVFGSTRADYYWSSTTADPTVLLRSAWDVEFDTGTVSDGAAKTNFEYVRAVRGGS